ncbi:TonB-dependent hemoglobin/transferrin/lactoferrin family receptor [Carnimonas bestiolae]|uniref:TonB-dependent receptor n=1 Tax=Carnimonas bestiolae TaxID=3402172 RepID=UPI003EDC80B4
MKRRHSLGGYVALSAPTLAVVMLVAATPDVATAAENLRNTSLDSKRSYRFDQPAMPLSDALKRISQTSHLPLRYQQTPSTTTMAPALHGEQTLNQALTTLLEDSGWQAQRASDGAIVIHRAHETSSPPSAVQQLDRITVLANRSDYVYSAPRAVSEITEEEIQRVPIRHTAELLRDTPGVTSAVNRYDPGLSINIRGMQDFGRVNMMIDGMRQNFVKTGHQQRNGQMYVDSELLSGVTLERGPRSNAHGAGAMAGQANFHTIDADDIIRQGNSAGVRLRGNSGLFGEGNGVHFIGSAAVAGKIDNFEWVAAHSRRSLGDYRLGKHGGIDHNTVAEVGQPETSRPYNDMKNARQRQDSDLLKGKYNFSPDQSLQLSYIATKVRYSSMADMNTALSNGQQEAWRKLGDSKDRNQNIALDYHFDPSDNPLVDLNAKLYFAHTKSNTDNAPPPLSEQQQQMSDMAHQLGFCDQNPVPASWQDACDTGTASNQKIRTNTLGLVVDNTSRWQLTNATQLSANYGVEFYQDRGRSVRSENRDGQQISSQPDGLNGNGHRKMESLFGNLALENELYTLSAGLRYDHYSLSGDTNVPGAKGENSYDRFMRLSCPANIYSQPDSSVGSARWLCEGGRDHGEAWLADHYSQWRSNPNHNPWGTGNSRPSVVSTQEEQHIHRSGGHFSPTLAAALRPTSWMELYANWGKSWRPPSLNETLMAGSHPEDQATQLFPNPNLDPETSTTWELGTNLNFQQLFTSDDRLMVKFDYFNTTAHNYIYTAIGNGMPADTGAGLNQTMFVNNLRQMRFRGLELQGQYDAGWLYGGVSYTRYIDSDNDDACKLTYPLGSAYPGNRGQVDCGNNAFNAMAVSPVNKTTAHLGTRLFERRLDTGIRYNYTGNGHYNPSAGGGQTSWSATTWDWYASVQIIDNLKLTAAIDNLTDQRYLDNFSDALAQTWAPGRTTTVGMEVAF